MLAFLERVLDAPAILQGALSSLVLVVAIELWRRAYPALLRATKKAARAERYLALRREYVWRYMRHPGLGLIHHERLRFLVVRSALSDAFKGMFFLLGASFLKETSAPGAWCAFFVGLYYASHAVHWLRPPRNWSDDDANINRWKMLDRELFSEAPPIRTDKVESMNGSKDDKGGGAEQP